MCDVTRRQVRPCAVDSTWQAPGQLRVALALWSSPYSLYGKPLWGGERNKERAGEREQEREGETHRNRERETERQRQTDRQKGRQAERPNMFINSQTSVTNQNK